MAEDYEKHEAWSKFLADNYGIATAISFAVGSDILLDDIAQDMKELSSMPSGSHIGQLSTSFIKDELPAQFLMRYDYNFLYQMKCALIHLRNRAKTGLKLTAHTVMEELLIYLCNIEAKAYAEICGSEEILDEAEEFDYYEDWVFELFEDTDFVYLFYSDWYLDAESDYYFDNWNLQFHAN